MVIYCCFVFIRKIIKRRRDKIDPYDTLELTVKEYEEKKANMANNDRGSMIEIQDFEENEHADETGDPKSKITFTKEAI